MSNRCQILLIVLVMCLALIAALLVIFWSGVTLLPFETAVAAALLLAVPFTLIADELEFSNVAKTVTTIAMITSAAMHFRSIVQAAVAQ